MMSVGSSFLEDKNPDSVTLIKSGVTGDLPYRPDDDLQCVPKGASLILLL
jgi:hypothetical protein